MERNKPYILDGERVSHEEYTKSKYEDLRIRVPKGKKAEIKSFAESRGKSLNGFVNEAIDNAMKDEQVEE